VRSAGTSRQHDDHVFINCPFDDEYRPIFDALVFAVFDCGFVARCSLEFAGSAGVRIDNIASLVEECKYGVHDISRTEPDEGSGLPRFNMPLELGLFLGAMKLGTTDQRSKDCLILDSSKYRYQRFISDIAGQDIEAHGKSPTTAVKKVRNWLNALPETDEVNLPGGTKMAERYEEFRRQLPDLCDAVHLDPDELTFTDTVYLASGWQQENPWRSRAR
jgi:hypothetical protein